ncbi:hypothetical protein [Photobacterium damselae]
MSVEQYGLFISLFFAHSATEVKLHCFGIVPSISPNSKNRQKDGKAPST